MTFFLFLQIVAGIAMGLPGLSSNDTLSSDAGMAAGSVTAVENATNYWND